MKSNLRIAINAQVPLESGSGGIETVLRALIHLGKLDGDEEYVFIGHRSEPDWLTPLLGEKQRVIRASSHKTGELTPFNRLFRRADRFAHSIGHYGFPLPKAGHRISVSDGFYESLGCDVIHFPYQDYVPCRIPSVYNPHDLQHLHYPQFFGLDEIARRECIYPAACRAAVTVAVASDFVKQDLINSYGIKANKVQVIPWAPPEKSLDKVRESGRLDLKARFGFQEESFALYPAMTWEHKNHLRLLEAIARLRDRHDLKINLICTGHKTDFSSRIESRINELKLHGQVIFTGVVPYEELSALYLQALFVVIPTIFEAASAPLFEAWQHEAPVACSTVTSLPEQASDAALLFNPFSVDAIADALKNMMLDENLRCNLRAKGSERLNDFTLERTAKTYRAVYRRAAGRKLNDEDRDLLEK